jgi:endonuclease/exonuclease/phosphatase family metal-dependent hydrolase
VRRISLFLSLALVLGACTDDSGNPRELRILTQNLYVGGYIDTLLMASSPAEIPVLTRFVWDQVQATDFRARAEVIAGAIASYRPHLVGLQEVSTFRIQSPGDRLDGNPVQAEIVALDFLQILVDELARHDLSYVVAAKTTNFDIEMPMLTDSGGLDDVRLTDYEAILVAEDLEVVEAISGNYTVNLQLPIGGPGGPVVTISRGWADVLVQTPEGNVRFIATHLEPGPTPVQAMIQQEQTAELIALATDSPYPTILAGDLNSRADGSGTATYQTMIDTGFLDVWDALNPGDTGYTCCQAPDLRNESPLLNRRIDLILTRNGLSSRRAEVLGEKRADRTAGDLWWSDHAGVFGIVRLR